MGEAILVKAGGSGSGSGNGGGSYIPITEIIQNNQTFTIPKTNGQLISVRLFGGGGGQGKVQWAGDILCGGGGGNMNNAILNIPAETKISIIIGNAGNKSNNGGTTSFGIYLSATGGECGTNMNGGNGGTGGGGSNRGGTGFYGGGGGSNNGGIGGTYGGGGGGYGNDGSPGWYGSGWGGGGGGYGPEGYGHGGCGGSSLNWKSGLVVISYLLAEE